MLIHWTLAAVHLIADHRGGHGHGAGGDLWLSVGRGGENIWPSWPATWSESARSATERSLW